MKTFPRAALLLTISLLAGPAVAADAPPSLDVWPGQAPGLPPQIAAEQWTISKPGEKPMKKVTNVSKPTLTVFRPPAGQANGVAVMVCPGGGYKSLMMDYEGEDVAAWLNTLGITGIVLKYRVPAPEGTPGFRPALQDAQRAMSLIRSKAKEWELDPARIGMLGFSAGGHLTAATSTNFDQRTYDAVDAVDQQDCRPDFAVVIYPGGVIAKGTQELSPEIRVSAKTPPTFIVQANDDRVNSENSVFYYLALKHAGVPAEIHIYTTGGHGFGIRPSTQPAATWPQRCQEWMTSRGILKREAAK